MHVRLIVDGELSKAFEYNSGVKQGCKLTATLYGIYAAVLLNLACKSIKHKCGSVQVRFRNDGVFFVLRRLQAKTKVLTTYIREAQYADDIAIFTDTAIGLQLLLTAYNELSKKMCLRINTAKTETMCIGADADFFIDDVKLENVTRFKYLGSYITKDCSMKEELNARIKATYCAFGRLRKRVFDSRDLTIETKIKVYNLQCLMPLFVYGSETWTLYHHQVRQLRTIQQRHLRSIMNINFNF